MLNVSIGIGTNVAVGEASLVFVQTIAAAERAVDEARRSDLTVLVRSMVAYRLKAAPVSHR